MPTAAMELSRSQRLDRLPLTAAHRRLLAGSGVGWALDAMDVGLVSFILAALAVQWSLSPGRTVPDRLHRVRGHGRRRRPRWAPRRSGRTPVGVRPDLAGLRAGHWCLRAVDRRGDAAGAALHHRPGAGRGVAGGLHAGQRVRPGPDPWPGGGDPRVVLGRRLGLRRLDRLLRGAVVGERVALGVRPRHAARGVRDRRPLEAARIGAIPGAPWPDRRSRSRRTAVRGLRRRGAGAVAGPPPGHRRAAQPGAALDPDVPGAHDRSVADLVRGQLRLLRRLHLVADLAGGVRVRPGQVVRVHPDHHLGPAPGLRGGRGADRAMGPPGDAGDVPRRVSVGGRRFRAGVDRAHRARRRDRPVVLQPGRLGSPVRRHARRSIRPRSGPPAPAAPPPSAGSPRSWPRWSCCPSETSPATSACSRSSRSRSAWPWSPRCSCRSGAAASYRTRSTQARTWSRSGGTRRGAAALRPRRLSGRRRTG